MNAGEPIGGLCTRTGITHPGPPRRNTALLGGRLRSEKSDTQTQKRAASPKCQCCWVAAALGWMWWVGGALVVPAVREKGSAAEAPSEPPLRTPPNVPRRGAPRPGVPRPLPRPHRRTPTRTPLPTPRRHPGHPPPADAGPTHVRAGSPPAAAASPTSGSPSGLSPRDGDTGRYYRFERTSATSRPAMSTAPPPIDCENLTTLGVLKDAAFRQ
ncbi:hypothetical protein HPB47_010436 [Ixodes persulcatus]|uniref:Uncharacterized protein n=1 Tax=Ixodes persulcatus TaxID=34615 RepID=A0AC60NZ35_IXOPE|nr:hypothetical protein HPB47_010436 [Ixodes persulcatus]